MSVLLAGLVPSMAVAAPSHTDVMFVFDTTGSMSGALHEATEEIQEAMTEIRAKVPDPEFGLAEMRDYTEVNNPGEFEYDMFESGPTSGFVPWTLVSPIGTPETTIEGKLATLFAQGGGDLPEAYGRALYETAQNPSVGWRSGARGVIILVADNVPHDNELNEGIPEAEWFESPFDTGVDPGADNTVGTADDLDFQQTVLPALITDGHPLEFVDYHGEPAYLPYWQNWAARTGGNALEAGATGTLAAQLTELVVAGASAPLPSCPSGEVRDSNERCASATPAGPSPSPGPAPTPPAPPSNKFSFVPRITCAGVCHVVLVQITFDSAGNVIMENIVSGEPTAMSLKTQDAPMLLKAKSKKKKEPLAKAVHQHVNAGKNTIKVQLTPAGIAQLKNHKGKLDLRFKAKFTPDGGSPKTSILHVNVTAPKYAGKGKSKGH